MAAILACWQSNVQPLGQIRVASDGSSPPDMHVSSSDRGSYNPYFMQDNRCDVISLGASPDIFVWDFYESWGPRKFR